ncbi:MAG: ORF6N domain-containing protein [Treponema sp.]|nr:ORF6N domain-containing protein [Treponema sp.]
MLDHDLAKLYGVPIHRLNEAVKRNFKRFPDDFMFQLSDEEWQNQRSHFAIFNKNIRKYRPYAFTEQGVSMLSSVINSEHDKAIRQIMNALNNLIEKQKETKKIGF